MYICGALVVLLAFTFGALLGLSLGHSDTRWEVDEVVKERDYYKTQYERMNHAGGAETC